ncbi:MAG: HEAT repeat domain-containing protein, partial [Phycisphaerales bacterium]|nr:HEAT repeat domain-containing protein [Phycisphaerales bacterium]
PEAASALSDLARSPTARTVQRVHAAWAIGMIARRDASVASLLVPLMSDADVQLRIQSVRTLGDLRFAAPEAYMTALEDADARVRYEACLALGKIGHRAAIGRLLEVLDAEGDRDVAMRHGASYGLAMMGDADRIADDATSRGVAARVGAVVALRRLESDRVIGFLSDASDRVVIEAARACYDQYRGLEDLAALLEGPFPGALGTEPFLRRVIEANVLVGTSEACERLARFATRSDVDGSWNQLALSRIDGWDEPLKREGVWGNWVDLDARDPEVARQAFLASAPALMTHPNEAVRTAAETIRISMIDVSLAMVTRQVGDPTFDAAYRVALLEQGASRFEFSLEAICDAALADDGDVPDVRLRALEMLATVSPVRAVEETMARVRRGSMAERQACVRLLATIPGGDEAMAGLVD